MSGKTSSKSSTSTNQDLDTLLSKYHTKYQDGRRITYPLFNAIALAFLKENNEENHTLMENDETRDELFDFCGYVMKSQMPNIRDVVSTFNPVS